MWAQVKSFLTLRLWFGTLLCVQFDGMINEWRYRSEDEGEDFDANSLALAPQSLASYVVERAGREMALGSRSSDTADAERVRLARASLHQRTKSPRVRLRPPRWIPDVRRHRRRDRLQVWARPLSLARVLASHRRQSRLAAASYACSSEWPPPRPARRARLPPAAHPACPLSDSCLERRIAPATSTCPARHLNPTRMAKPPTQNKRTVTRTRHLEFRWLSLSNSSKTLFHQSRLVRKIFYSLTIRVVARGGGQCPHHESLLPPPAKLQNLFKIWIKKLIVEYCSSIARKQMKWCFHTDL